MRNRQICRIPPLAACAIFFALIVNLFFFPRTDFISHASFSPLPSHDGSVVTATSSASWTELFDSVEELAASADVGIIAKLISSETELRHNIVFTRNTIEVLESHYGGLQVGDQIVLVQTGGVYGDQFTPAISEVPLLESDTCYAMYLKQTDPHSIYGQYYLVAGGHQGLVKLPQYPSARSFSQNSFTDHFIGKFVSSRATPIVSSNHVWDTSTIRCHLSDSILINYGVNMYNALGNGVTSWNSTQAPTIVFTEDPYTWDVLVDMYDYGECGWDGLHTAHLSYSENDSEPNTILYSRIEVNEWYKSQYLDELNLWRAIACHEMGHSLGLGHNTNSSETSIMKEWTGGYYNVNGSPKIYSYQPADQITINALY